MKHFSHDLRSRDTLGKEQFEHSSFNDTVSVSFTSLVKLQHMPGEQVLRMVKLIEQPLVSKVIKMSGLCISTEMISTLCEHLVRGGITEPAHNKIIGQRMHMVLLYK